MALTATATPAVVRDIKATLKLTEGALVHISGFNRPEISYEVRYKDLLDERGRRRLSAAKKAETSRFGKKNEFKTAAELLKKQKCREEAALSGTESESESALSRYGGAIVDLLQYIKKWHSTNSSSASGVVYVHKREDTVRLAGIINKETGASACAYHAGLKEADRMKAQEDWSQKKVKVSADARARVRSMSKSALRREGGGAGPTWRALRRLFLTALPFPLFF